MVICIEKVLEDIKVIKLLLNDLPKKYSFVDKESLIDTINYLSEDLEE